jgi:hypothetical protein
LPGRDGCQSGDGCCVARLKSHRSTDRSRPLAHQRRQQLNTPST